MSGCVQFKIIGVLSQRERRGEIHSASSVHKKLKPKVGRELHALRFMAAGRGAQP